MGLGVPVEAGGVGEDGAAGEDGDAAVGLLGGGEDAEDALAAGDGDALALELVDNVARAGVGRGGDDGDGHGVAVCGRAGLEAYLPRHRDAPHYARRPWAVHKEGNSADITIVYKPSAPPK